MKILVKINDKNCAEKLCDYLLVRIHNGDKFDGIKVHFACLAGYWHESGCQCHKIKTNTSTFS